MNVSKQERKNAFRFIVALGFVSLFADMTYEGAHSVIGPLLKDLGASATQVGIIAGLGEMIAASLRYFSGRLADKTRGDRESHWHTRGHESSERTPVTSTLPGDQRPWTQISHVCVPERMNARVAAATPNGGSRSGSCCCVL